MPAGCKLKVPSDLVVFEMVLDHVKTQVFTRQRVRLDDVSISIEINVVLMIVIARIVHQNDAELLLSLLAKI